MNLYKSLNKFCVFLAASCLLLAHGSYAVDFEGLQNQCAELGFKIKTPENGKCVLKLRNKIIDLNNEISSDSAPVVSQSIEAANQRNSQRQQQYAKDLEIEQKNREIEALRQQQAIQLQQQQLAIQKQQEPNSLLLFLMGANAALDGYNAGRSYKPATPTYQPPRSVNCTTSMIGNIANTNCR